jgi:energy-coupling factor transporter ATP-binding protein EcfA2
MKGILQMKKSVLMCNEITCEEMVHRFEDIYCDDKYVIIICKHEFGSVMIYTDRLQVYEHDGKISITDDNDLEMIIDRCCISSISVSRNYMCEEMTLDLGNSKIVFCIS